MPSINVEQFAEPIDPPRRRLQPFHFIELHALPPQPYIIKGLLDQGAFSVLYGESGSGKTFAALHIAAHVAQGWSWFDMKVNATPVFYLSAEGGPSSISRRLDAFASHYGLDEAAPLFVHPGGADLLSKDADITPLIAEASAVEAGMVVIDTLSRVLVGGNENAPDDMGAFVANVDRIRQDTGAHCMVVHHSGKDTARGARGHSLLRAASDSELEVSRDKASGIGSIAVTKARDYADDATLAFKLQPVELGHDEDGDKIVSCALVPTDEKPPEKANRVSGQRRIVLDLLRKALDAEGKPSPGGNHIPQNVKVVSVETWRRYAYAGLPSDGTQEAKKKAFQRAVSGLQSANAIGLWDDYVWTITG